MIETKWVNQKLQARRTDGMPLRDEDKAEVEARMTKLGVTVSDAIGIFSGGIVVRLDLECKHCGPGAKIIKAVWPHCEKWICHYCAREATPKE
jgi:hypothetical protein